MTKLFSTVAGVSLAFALSTGVASARDQIQVSGSSTVLPYAKIVAETFGETYPNFKIPVIESGGSGAGIKEFCRGVGANTIDIANSSRPMKNSELQSCMDAGVKDVQEIRIGYDGIVFATDINGPDWALTPVDVYKALAAQIVVDGKLQPNTAAKWNTVNSALPDWDIAAYIPGEKHGTREVFEEKLMSEGCKESGAEAAMKSSGMDDKAIAAACIAVRKDGKAVDIDGDYSETLARIASNKTGVGVFGLAFYENNADKLKIATVNGIRPSVETISSGEYPVSRPLFFYVKKAHLGVIPGLKEYVEFFLSDQMVGPDGPLAEYGLVAAPDEEREDQRAKFENGTVMSVN
ncbi:PstS family phosphate ABC transporter substrate-binding protein [Bartonella tamiae]|uniref:Phosphate binding protein n=1 Tax=Bartonella tamiae Th239 TaxID=1094558 RepID=J0R3Q8_9HYPH|nr:substrate-binding domain-containing protein [Bartonella tamiae]EJF90264.1 phosphate binding protein [Bartonella tamiae Th239]EJF93795.1 phosphate binding protein [Bartonella tamiae Th307]